MASSMVFLVSALLVAFSASASAAVIGGTSNVANLENQNIIDYNSYGNSIPAYATVSAADAAAELANGTLPIAVTDFPIPPTNPPHFTLPQVIVLYSFFVSGSTTVRLNATQLYQIFVTGALNDWSQINNSGLTGPILPIVRSDASASTALITQWLQQNGAPINASQIGNGPWNTGNPNTQAYTGVQGVATAINIFSGAIGYLPSGLGNNVYSLNEVAIKNKLGAYVTSANGVFPDFIFPAADADWTSFSLINNFIAYPIAQYAYVSVLESYPNNGATVVPFLYYLFNNHTQTSAIQNFYYLNVDDLVLCQNFKAIAKISY